MQGHGVARDLHDLWAQVEVLEEVSRGGSVGVDVLVGPTVTAVKVEDEVEQLAKSPLVKHAQQICNAVLNISSTHLSVDDQESSLCLLMQTRRCHLRKGPLLLWQALCGVCLLCKCNFLRSL